MDFLNNIAAYADNTSTTTTFDLFSVLTIVGLWKMFNKAGQPGWPSLIPFYNTYKLCEITMGNPWYWLRLLVFFIPVVGWIAGFYFLYQMGKATALSFGKTEGWAFGYAFLSGIFYCITGFDSSEYYGPMGAGDNRTQNAREAKTVNFDVIKNEPSQGRDDIRVEEVRKSEEDVDFFFDQPEE